MVSVAMCTYNGCNHIKEQLESILKQTRKPDEIIVCDDGSTDNTVAIVKQVLSRSSIKYMVVCNSKTLGFRKNFEKTIGLCRGDLIFLSDQDDIWLPDKIEIMANVLEQNKKAILAFHDVSLVDGKRNQLYSSFWKILHFNYKKVLDNNFDIFLLHNVVQGSACVIKKELYDQAIPFSSVAYHDEWLALVALIYGKIIPVNCCLMQYRQENNLMVNCKLNLNNYNQETHSIA